MSTLAWIVLSGVLMSMIALIGSITLLLPEPVLRRVLLPLVAFSAGSLLGGAFFHMVPASIEHIGDPLLVSVLVISGFTLFFLLEHFLHWHQCHLPDHAPSHEHAHGARHRPLVYLIVLGDGLHNFIGGLAIGSTFLIDVRLGIASWLAAAAHEIPQELGDFGVLVHSGLSKRRALFVNFVSASTFLLGGLLTYFVSSAIEVDWLVPLAAGNFIYIAASDLVPEVHKQTQRGTNLLHLPAFFAGLGLLLLLKLMLPH
jgi:zinc and cadmium transporter